MKTRSLLATVAALTFLSAPTQANDTLDVLAQFEIQGPEPSTVGYDFWRMGIADTLVRANPDGQLVPALATWWSVSDDRLT
ncbi:hypothetical protein [Oceaniglobus trochenteri]|uniref:hypothetical protein n=1 Tax=Oceaniglobus trochenteri TaxID=2763260 RepID=UPI001CFF7DF7|nr:hypothetical protein [Oceaniglobus trochenteri]